MANEAILRDRTENPINFTVADGTGIEKGTICTMTDPRTAIATSATGAKLAGIAASEKIASDGRTSLGIFRRGIFDCIASGSIAIGEPVAAAALDNYVVKANTSGASILGHALEAASDEEVFQVWVDVGAGGNSTLA